MKRLTPFKAKQDLVDGLVRTRKAAGYTQKELAKRAGVSLNTYQRLEANGSWKVDTFLKVAGILGDLSALQGVFATDEAETIEDIKKRVKGLSE